MNNKIIYLFFLIVLVGCNEKQTTAENDYIESYKFVVFFECVNSSTYGSMNQYVEENNDYGVAREVGVIYHSDFKLAKQVGSQFSKNIQVLEIPDNIGKKPVLSKCYEYSISDYVDSIAKARFKLLKSIK